MRIRNMAIYFTAGVPCVYSMLRFYSGFMITVFVLAPPTASKREGMWEPALAFPECAAPHPGKGLRPLHSQLASCLDQSRHQREGMSTSTIYDQMASQVRV